jgi:hypothetical protein
MKKSNKVDRKAANERKPLAKRGFQAALRAEALPFGRPVPPPSASSANLFPSPLPARSIARPESPML